MEIKESPNISMRMVGASVAAIIVLGAFIEGLHWIAASPDALAATDSRVAHLEQLEHDDMKDIGALAQLQAAETQALTDLSKRIDEALARLDERVDKQARK